MKKLVSMVMGLAAAAAFAIPMPQVQLLTFSIQGTETYADGSALADGECYALVWSADGVFEGVNADGTAKGAGDEVIYIGQIAKGKDVAFQIADGFKSGGFFDIWILDTRVFDNGTVQSIGKTAGGQVTVTKAVKATSAAVRVSGSGASAPTTVAGVEGGAVISAPTVDPATLQNAKITKITLDGDFVILEMEGTVPGGNYAAVGAADLTKGASVESGVTTATGSKVQVIVPKTGDSGFFWAKPK